MAKPKQTVMHDPISDRQCIWKTDGHRCQSDGSISLSTYGGGPWYCPDHFFSLKVKGPEHPEVMAKIDERVNRIVPRNANESMRDWSMRCKAYVLDFVKKLKRNTGNRDWARRIFAREEKGEQMPLIAVQFANEALQIERVAVIQTEPGELG